MTDKKNGNAFTNNPLVRAIGVQKIVVVIVLIALIAFFSAVSPSFRQYSTLLSIMDYTYYLAFLGIGVTFCLITGGVDLSIGTGMFCYALIGGYLITRQGMPVIVGILATLICGLVMGIITTGGASVTWPGATAPNGWTRSLFKLTVGELKLPLGFLWVMILAVVMSIVLNKTRTGRYIIAIGSNKEATRLSGINVAKYQTMAYIFSGIFTGLAALAYSSAFQSMAPGGGGGVELNAIGGAIIGGTSMSGGAGSISGTILGVFIMSVLQTGLPLIGLQANYQQIIIGLVLIVAVYIDVLKNKKLDK